jgi:hypothetical protein
VRRAGASESKGGLIIRGSIAQSAISNQQSAISNQQSAISNQQSAISNQQSAISNQQSAPPLPCPALVPDDQGGDDDVEDLSEDSFWGGLFGIHCGG